MADAKLPEYRVAARRLDAHGSLATCKGASIALDTDLAGRISRSRARVVRPDRSHEVFERCMPSGKPISPWFPRNGGPRCLGELIYHCS